MLAPLLHIAHPTVHNHQYDAREQLEHHLAGHTLIEYLAEEIYRVGLERGIERIWEGIELLFYGVQLVFIVVGTRLLLLEGDRRIYEERLGCPLTISGAGDESQFGSQDFAHAMDFLIIYQIELVEDPVSCLGHFAGIIAPLYFHEAAEPLPSLFQVVAQLCLQRRPGIGTKGILIGICGI